ncbi:MAG: NF038122 family metalloprotease [Cyanobacteria bacterium P01_F01_bin.150]
MANYDVGVLQSSETSRSYTVTYNNPTDVFKFEMSQNGTIHLELEDISSGTDADLYLYRDNGNGYLDNSDERIAYSYNGGNDDEGIDHATTAGTYFAEVQHYSGGTSAYTLDMSATYSGSSGSDSSGSGSGLKFNFTYEGNGYGISKVSQQQMIAFEMAGKIWSHHLNDNMTVNIHVDIADNLPDNVIGGAVPGFISEQYSTLRSNLSSDASSYNDSVAVSNLGQSTLTSKVRLQSSDGYWAWYGGQVSSVNPTRANLKAIDSSPSVRNSSSLDGYILMSNLNNSSYSWHYDHYTSSGQNLNTLNSSELDFLSVAVHEIGHVLGFVSGVDYQASDWISMYSGDLYSHSVADQKMDITRERMNVSSILDLFRYSDNVGNSGRGNDASLGGNPYFSINGGSSQLREFANGRSDDTWLNSRIKNGLDDYQASHWDLSSDGVMVPAIAPGQRNIISSEELKAFDVLGFDRTDEFSSPNYSDLYQSAQATVNQYSSSRTTQSRLDDVLAMIDASPMYEGRRGSRSTRWQELLDVFAQEALNSSFDEKAWLAYLESITLNESGTVGEDLMQGSIGGDRFRGMEDDDVIKGFEGDDVLKGNQGSDRILGGEGNDTLIGGNGNDILKGEEGNDWLKGSAGIDVLVGGEGTDTFVIDNAAGFSIIRDFNSKEDELIIAEGLDVIVGQRNNHTIISHADDSDNILAVLRNVDSESISLQ